MKFDLGTRPPNILVVDDEPQNIRLIAAMLGSEPYLVRGAGSGEEALVMVAQQPPDLIILDVVMPGVGGLEVAKILKADATTRSIPIIMVTSLRDREHRLAGLNTGAEDFLAKPVDRAELWARVRNLLRLKEYGDLLASHNLRLEVAVRERTAALRESYAETIYALIRAATYKDEETGQHVQRITFYCQHLGKAMGMDDAFIDTLGHASPMHDIGKIGVPDHVLFKSGPHTAEEREIMNRHCEIGARILGASDSPYMRMAAEIALAHHERWDGSGYPNRLVGEQIPISARIMSICDVYDALRSKRPYKPAYDHDKSVRIITEGDGRTQPGHFDPVVLEAFKRCSSHFADIFAGYCEEVDSHGIMH